MSGAARSRIKWVVVGQPTTRISVQIRSQSQRCHCERRISYS